MHASEYKVLQKLETMLTFLAMARLWPPDP